ncbi:hypothetical protein BU15DRAFT_62756 [Melanogaster broomeanus]|nr:hypothetical protein BU15DRAFT_62756 [Melanogaster broomeanus]
MATTTSRVSRLAALAQPIRPCEDDKAAVLKDFEKAAAKLHAVAVTAPDDKDELVEKEIWCRQWNRVHGSCSAEQLHAQWSEEIMRRDEDARRQAKKTGVLAHARGYPIHAPSTSTRARTAEINGGGDNVRAKDLEEEDKEDDGRPARGHGRARQPDVPSARRRAPRAEEFPGAPARSATCTSARVRSGLVEAGRQTRQAKRQPGLCAYRKQDLPVDSRPSVDGRRLPQSEEPKEKAKAKTPVASSKTEISKAQLELYMQNIVKGPEVHRRMVQKSVPPIGSVYLVLVPYFSRVLRDFLKIVKLYVYKESPLLADYEWRRPPSSLPLTQQRACPRGSMNESAWSGSLSTSRAGERLLLDIPLIHTGKPGDFKLLSFVLGSRQMWNGPVPANCCVKPLPTLFLRVLRFGFVLQIANKCKQPKAETKKWRCSKTSKSSGQSPRVAVTAPDDKDELEEKEIMCAFLEVPPLRRLRQAEQLHVSGLKRSCDVRRMPRGQAKKSGHVRPCKRGCPNPRAFYLNQGRTPEINGGGDNVQAKGGVQGPCGTPSGLTKIHRDPVKTWRKRTRKRRPSCPDGRATTARAPNVRRRATRAEGLPRRACEACTVHKVASRLCAYRKRDLPVDSRPQLSTNDDDDCATEEPKEKGKTKTSPASSKTEISKGSA